MENKSVYLESKPRYEILDGLRGVAALIVVAFHLFETYSGGPLTQIINHGYLAVDFFFVLSGYVIGYAYDDRWDRMTVGSFLKRRIVRLHPMVIMGTILAGCLFYFGQCQAFPLIADTIWSQLLLMLLLGCLMIPAPSSMDVRGWGEVYVNGPAWSLMWEYVANVLYALFIRRFGKAALAFFVLVSAFLTLNLTLNWDIFGLLSSRAYAAYTVIGGWSLDPDQLCVGASRLLYPFFCGLLLSRCKKVINVAGGFWWCALIVAVLLFMPRIGGREHMLWNGIYEAFCILIAFPVVVMIGAGSVVKGRKSIGVCKFLGDISYPLYITHFPFIYMQIAYASHHPEATLEQKVMMGIGVMLISVSTAYASLKLYDIPVRNWLRDHWLKSKK